MGPLQALIIVIIRLWSAGALITAITSFPSSLFLPGVQEDIAYLRIYSVFNSMVWLIAGAIGWLFAPKFAKKVFPDARKESVNFTIDADKLVMLGSFLIGAFYLAQYAPSWFSYVGLFLIESRSQDITQPFAIRGYRPPFDFERFYKEGLIVLVAIWMIFRPAHIASIFSNLRHVGLHKEDPER